jgi:hypothetical protein
MYIVIAKGCEAMHKDRKYFEYRFKEKSKYLNFDAIEKELKIPQSTLHRWIAGKRNLPKKWEPVLIKWVEEFKK